LSSQYLLLGHLLRAEALLGEVLPTELLIHQLQ